MKQYFLMLSKPDSDLETALTEYCHNVFRINYSISSVYFFTAEDSLNSRIRKMLHAAKDLVFMDITEANDFVIKMANQEENDALSELLEILKKENANDVDGVLDKIQKYGSSSLTNRDLMILKSL